MIVSASYKTDIPAFFSDWFVRRLEAGACRVRNPYNNRPFTVDLRPAAVDGFVFWTRNVEPFFPALDRVHTRHQPFVVQFTLTGYPRALDRATIEPSRARHQIKSVAKRFGARAAVWRYDPVMISSITDADWHRHNFKRLCRGLRGSVDEVVVSFAQIYKKTRRNLNISAAADGFQWFDPDPDAKQELLSDLADTAHTHDMALTLCGQPELLVPAIEEARCIDAVRLSDIAGKPIRALHKAHRNRCGCWESKDIGAYDTCPHGCAYCYAVGNRDAAKQNFKEHDPAGELLFSSQPNPEKNKEIAR